MFFAAQFIELMNSVSANACYGSKEMGKTSKVFGLCAGKIPMLNCMRSPFAYRLKYESNENYYRCVYWSRKED